MFTVRQKIWFIAPVVIGGFLAFSPAAFAAGSVSQLDYSTQSTTQAGKTLVQTIPDGFTLTCADAYDFSFYIKPNITDPVAFQKEVIFWIGNPHTSTAYPVGNSYDYNETTGLFTSHFTAPISARLGGCSGTTGTYSGIGLQFYDVNNVNHYSYGSSTDVVNGAAYWDSTPDSNVADWYYNIQDVSGPSPTISDLKQLDKSSISSQLSYSWAQTLGARMSGTVSRVTMNFKVPSSAGTTNISLYFRETDSNYNYLGGTNEYVYINLTPADKDTQKDFVFNFANPITLNPNSYYYLFITTTYNGLYIYGSSDDSSYPAGKLVSVANGPPSGWPRDTSVKDAYFKLEGSIDLVKPISPNLQIYNSNVVTFTGTYDNFSNFDKLRFVITDNDTGSVSQQDFGISSENGRNLNYSFNADLPVGNYTYYALLYNSFANELSESSADFQFKIANSPGPKTLLDFLNIEQYGQYLNDLGYIGAEGGDIGRKTAQSITFSDANKILESVDLKIRRKLGSDGVFVELIRKTGFAGAEDGELIATSDMFSWFTNGTAQVVNFSFPLKPTLLKGETYFIVLGATQSFTNVNELRWDVFLSDQNYNGADNFLWTNFRYWIPQSGNDLAFRLWGDTETTPIISNLGQLKSDGITTIAPGGTTTEDTVNFQATVTSPSNNQVSIGVQVLDPNNNVVKDVTSSPVPSGSIASVSATGLIDGQYHWQARAVDSQNNHSDFQPFGTGGVDFVVSIPLSTKAANLAKTVIDGPYLGDGNTFGGKGWDPLQVSYVTPNEVTTDGYHYWNNKLRTVAFGAGLDCSGLVQWAFNRSFNPSKSLLHNAIRYDGADGQYKHNSETVAEANLLPGDLLFLDKNSNSIKDHVAMYVGDNVTFDIVEAFSPQQGIRSTTKAEFEARAGFVASQDLRRVALSPAIGGSLQAGSPIDLAVTNPDGFTITATTSIQTDEEFLREAQGELYYSESELGSDGKPEDVVYWPIQKTGDYVFKAIPEVGVSPTSTYNLTFQTGSTTVLLAQNVPISQIPIQGYGITTSVTGAISSFIPVAIDIKPGSYPNSINLGSSGVVPVAILGSAIFDVRQIDVTTINIANAPVKLKNNGHPMTSYSDINGDGFIDLVSQVPTQALQLTATSTKADLVGRLTNGTIIKGSDSVRIVP